MAGANFDPTFFDKPEIKHSILDGLVTQHLLGEEARHIGLSLTDEQIAQIIASIGAFQVDGKFDKKRYEEVLSSKGMSRSGYSPAFTKRKAVTLPAPSQKAGGHSGF